MTAIESFLQNSARTSRGQDASQRLLATLAAFALAASIISIGIIMVVLTQTLPTISVVMNNRPSDSIAQRNF